ncbi:hypothetical protein K9N68_26065 [Kovacikia minuta CCNUW1]|uniref:hypothetical protein n=1 Tax=Kovacikia minuta TaxID=2931930 RepID=UPI001CCB6F62|nr:hypothetical protein [Kovacikia minuta]UBF25070.1 hypothetical protein K9N68_26065 [Kovacikia minuta CCNUW1]
MPTLTFWEITCNQIKPAGGAIELYIPTSQNQTDANSPNQKGLKIWKGTKPMIPGQIVNFNALPPDQKPVPVSFINPVRITLWDVKHQFPVKTIEINPTNVNSSYTFEYFGGKYTLNCVLTADSGVLVA